jgi:ABC-type uncharacterized transport system substrate-binding protein
MRRRHFITMLGGAATWPLSARAEQDRTRRIAMVTAGADENDPDARANSAAFVQTMQQLGWTDGRNMLIQHFWGRCQPEAVRKHAAELAALAPNVVLASGSLSLGALLQATRTVPIVFANVVDPVGSGFVDSLSQPGGNATGFHAIRIQLERQVAGGAQADCAGRDARRDSA